MGKKGERVQNYFKNNSKYFESPEEVYSNLSSGFWSGVNPASKILGALSAVTFGAAAVFGGCQSTEVKNATDAISQGNVAVHDYATNNTLSEDGHILVKNQNGKVLHGIYGVEMQPKFPFGAYASAVKTDCGEEFVADEGDFGVIFSGIPPKNIQPYEICDCVESDIAEKIMGQNGVEEKINDGNVLTSENYSEDCLQKVNDGNIVGQNDFEIIK